MGGKWVICQRMRIRLGGRMAMSGQILENHSSLLPHGIGFNDTKGGRSLSEGKEESALLLIRVEAGLNTFCKG